jgi:hypothetical protein
MTTKTKKPSVPESQEGAGDGVTADTLSRIGAYSMAETDESPSGLREHLAKHTAVPGAMPVAVQVVNGNGNGYGYRSPGETDWR